MAKRIPQMDEILAVAATRGANSEAPYLWKDLAGAWPMQEGEGGIVYDVSGYGNHGTLTNMDPATDWIATEKGKSLDFDGVNDELAFGTPRIFDFNTVSAFTLSIRARTLNISRRQALWGCAGGNPIWGLMFEQNKIRWFRMGKYYELISDTSCELGRFYSITVRGENYGGLTQIWIDGQKDPNILNANPTFDRNLTDVNIGAYADDYGHVSATNAVLHHRPISAAEIQELYEDPWAMYRIRPRVFRAAIIEAPTLSGSTGIEFGISGKLTALASLAGQSQTAFSTTGNLTAIANLSGQTQLAFTTDGQLSGLAALSGTSDLAFSATAKPSGTAQLSADASIAFGAAGRISGTANLSGQSQLVFSATGKLSRTASLLGSTALRFASAGQLSGYAYCRGTTGIQFGLQGELFQPAHRMMIAAASTFVAGPQAGQVR